MPIMYEPTPYDINTDGDSLTEQEHKDSCDINKMMKNALRGMDVRGGSNGTYGHDDMTMDGLSFRIEKAKLETDLQNGPKEFTQELLDLIPTSIQKKFGYKKVQNNEKLNNDKTAPTIADSSVPATNPPTGQVQT